MNNNNDLAKSICVLVFVCLVGIIFKACDTMEAKKAAKNTKPKETVRIWVIDHYIEFDKLR